MKAPNCIYVEEGNEEVVFNIRSLDEFDGGSVIVVKLNDGPSVVTFVGRAVVEKMNSCVMDVIFKLGIAVVEMFPISPEELNGGRVVEVELTKGPSVVILVGKTVVEMFMDGVVKLA